MMETKQRDNQLSKSAARTNLTAKSVEESITLDQRHGRDLQGATMKIGSKAAIALEYKGYQALVTRTVDVFGDELVASRWLSNPSVDFHQRTPLEIAEEVGYDPVAVEKLFEPIFIRIEHGIDW